MTLDNLWNKVMLDLNCISLIRNKMDEQFDNWVKKLQGLFFCLLFID